MHSWYLRLSFILCTYLGDIGKWGGHKGISKFVFSVHKRSRNKKKINNLQN